MKIKSDLSLRRRLAERELAQHILVMRKDIKPNFAAVARMTGMHRQTVAKIWKEMNCPEEAEPPKERKKRKSKFDPYRNEIVEQVNQPAFTLKAVFKYFQDVHGSDVFNSYDSFKSYVRTNSLMEYRRVCEKANPRYETEAGKQVQFDWKENIKFELDTGEIVEFNLFSAVFSFSRYTIFIYSKTKTTQDLIRCLIQLIRKVGGLPREFLTDNMSAIVSMGNNGKDSQVHPPIRQLEKDMDTPIRRCKPRSPKTKGKVESANRFVSWIQPYQGKLHTEQELIALIDHLNEEVNKEVCETTRMPRNTLFRKEKEYLRPVPSKLVLESYLKEVSSQKVPSTLLVKYKGNGYSVPKKYIGKRVKLFPIDDELYIYYNSDLIAVHDVSQKQFNYRLEDYTEAMREQMPKSIEDSEVARRAEANLKNLDNIGCTDGSADQSNDNDHKPSRKKP